MSAASLARLTLEWMPSSLYCLWLTSVKARRRRGRVGRAERRKQCGHLLHRLDLQAATGAPHQMRFDAGPFFPPGRTCQEIFKPFLNDLVHVFLLPYKKPSYLIQNNLYAVRADRF